MKQMLILLLCTMAFLVSTCKNEDEKCHYSIQIKNNTVNPIISAIPLRNSDNKCRLDGVTISAANQYNYRPYNFSIEKSLSNNTLDIYIVDTSQFNMPNRYYSCDSIEIKNKILKHYILTLEDLKKKNFIITYP